MDAEGCRLLVIEDEPEARRTIRLYAEHQGFAVAPARDGGEGLALARSWSPHLVVLDLMLPGVDGSEVCRQLRRESPVPIIMVTARTHEEQKLRSFRDGADDYLTKPFSPRELMARIHAVLRRTAAPLTGELALRGGRIVVDERRHRVLRDGVEVRLTPSELRIVLALAGEPRVRSREELLARALEGGSEATGRTIDVHVRNLRRKLDLPGEPSLIATVFGEGYRLEP